MRRKSKDVLMFLVAVSCACTVTLTVRQWCSAWPGTTDGTCVRCDCIEVYGYGDPGVNNTWGWCKLDNNNQLLTYEASAREDLTIGSNGMTGYCRQKPAFAVAAVITKLAPTDGSQICTGAVQQGMVEKWWSQFNNPGCSELRKVCTNSAFFPDDPPLQQ